MQQETETITPRDYRPKGRANKKNKNNCEYKIKDVYNYFSDSIVKGSRFDLPFNEVKKIWCKYLKNAMDHIIDDAGELQLTRSLGIIRIKKIKTNYKKPKIDFQKTIELGQIVFHDNTHTNGYYIRFYWKPVFFRTEYVTRYAFLAEKKQRRRASALFKTGKMDYFT